MDSPTVQTLSGAPTNPGSSLVSRLARLADTQTWRRAGTELASRYALPFLGVYLATAVTYSYLFTTVVLTNHTFPNAFVSDYPSYRTSMEGRWFADFIIFLVGGAGVQSLQMAIGAGIQAANGLLFASLLGIQRRLHLFLVAGFLALHPAFLDYYSFTIDHIGFTLGDMLALLGVLALDRVSGPRTRLLVAIPCLVLSVATYQPKVALIAVLLLVWCIRGLALSESRTQPEVTLLQAVLRSQILCALTAFGSALVLYWLSAKALISFTHGARSNINSVGAMLRQFAFAYPEVLQTFSTRVDFLPRALKFLPALGMVLGVLALVRRAGKTHWGRALGVLLLTGLAPAALQLTYIINDQAWRSNGRLLTSHAYFWLFLLTSIWTWERFRAVASVLLALFVYLFGVVGSQETNAVALKHIFDVEKINRIAARVESAVPDLYLKPHPVVVVGHKWFDARKFKQLNNVTYTAHLRSETFEVYRQIEIMNFFLGGEVLTQATGAERDAALADAASRRPWPAPESVYVHEGVVVVLLEPYAASTPVTDTR